MPDRQPPKPSARETGRTSFTKSDLEQAKPSLSLSKDRTIFSAAELKRDVPLRDQDNAGMRPKPRGITLDNPRLAPPGMSGIKTGDRAIGLARSSAVSDSRPTDRPTLKKEPGDVGREFKWLASGQSKDRGVDR
jgi:hypothetical protein